MIDANVLAVRLDYAVAANLNVWGTFLTAERVGHGYGWGFISPCAGGSTNYVRRGTCDSPAPAIPDRHLGWEFNLGVDWQLLEGLLLNARLAYWQPGRWFNYACISRTNPGWTAPAAANSFGIDPNRAIDAVMGIDIVMAYNS